MITPSSIFYTVAQGVLRALGATATQTNMNLLIAWMGEENGWQATFAWKNPMNTTLDMPGATSMNGAGVKAYPTWAEGFEATAKTLNNGLYPTLLSALKNSDANSFFSAEGKKELETWSGGDTSYDNTIYTIYSELAPVPSAYLTAHAATSGETVPGWMQDLQKGASTLGDLLGLNNFASGFKANPTLTVIVAATVVVLLMDGMANA